MTTKAKRWSSAPLPFQGQKRNFASAFREVLRLYPGCTTIVDLFGGSGLLARISKDERPDVRVVFNDFDNFTDRVKNIANTNRLLHSFREVVAGLKRHSVIPKDKKEAIISIIEKEDGYVDFVSISSSLLFSMKYVTSLDELKKQTFYNNVRLNDYGIADGYMDGIDVVKGDYKEIFERYKNDKNILWLVDPPYLSTDCTTYNNLYWKLGDYLDVLRVLQGANYVYFTSNKSSIVELCEWLGDGRVTVNPFINSKKIIVRENMNYNTSYDDIMIYKIKETV